MNKSLSLFALSLALALVLCAGCGRPKSIVSGTVSYRGQPLPNGNVAFFDSNGNPLAAATIHDGKYTVEDLPTGSTTITVTTPPQGAPAPKEQQAETTVLKVIPIPLQYGNPKQSNLTYEVKPGPQDHPIELQ